MSSYFLLSLIRLIVFLCRHTLLPQKSYFLWFLLHKTSVEYTRLLSAITEVLLYTIELRIAQYDVFLSFGCWIEPYWCMNFIETVHNIQSNSVHYFLSWTNHSLAPLKIRRYHHFSCPTQQLFYEVEIICFSIILMTNKPFFSRIHISIPSSFLTSIYWPQSQIRSQ